MTDATTDVARRRYDELYQRSLSHPEAFWLEAAGRLDWTRPPERALELREGSSFAWFPGDRTNEGEGLFKMAEPRYRRRRRT